MLSNTAYICHFLSAFCLSDRWLRCITALNQCNKVEKQNTFINSVWLLSIINFSASEMGASKSTLVMILQTNEPRNQSFLLFTSWAVKSVALIHHRPHIILILMALASSYCICFVTDARWMMGFFTLLIIGSDNLPHLTTLFWTQRLQRALTLVIGIGRGTQQWPWSLVLNKDLRGFY